MGVPSAAIVYTGESGNMPGSGRGAAYAESVSSTLENTNQWLKDIRENERLKNKEAQQKANAWNSMLEETPDIWNIDFEKVREKAEIYNNYVIGLQQQGYDPYNLPPAEMRELNRLQSEVVRETNAAKANKDWWDKNSFNIDDDAGKTWDQGYATEWFKNYSNPNLSPSERAKFRQESSPYLKNVDLVDIVASIGKQMEDQKITQGGYDITQKSAEDFKNLISIYFADQAGMEDYEALMGSGKYKTEDDLINESVSIFNSLYKPDKVRRGGSGGGGGTKKDKNKISIVGKNKIPDAQWSQAVPVNKLILDKNPAIYAYSNRVINEDGTAEDKSIPVANFVPQDGFYITPGGNVTAIGYGTSQDGKLVNVEVDYDFNKGNFEAAGYPNMFDAFRAISGGGTSNATAPLIDPN